MTLTYGQLPSTTGTGQRQPTMACFNEDCVLFLDLFSAERGDYFLAPDDAPVVCSACDEPMSLAAEVRTIERR